MPVRLFSKNVHGIYNTIGNIAELVDQEQTAKGGNWLQGIEEISFKKNQFFDRPSL